MKLQIASVQSKNGTFSNCAIVQLLSFPVKIFPCSVTGYCPVQVDPNSIAARDGRIREGDRILQVCDNRLFLKLFLQTNAQCHLLCGLLMREGSSLCYCDR